MTAADRAGDERPLVTFAVFGYNQEPFIRDAVEGAFSQTYSPLEIILSDDGSSDRTFEIMQEMAAAYRGPHQVRAVRQDPNLGTVKHLMAVARLGRGLLLVVNAGDDVSHPDRTSVIEREWTRTGASAYSSFYDEIAEDGRVLRKNCEFPPSADTQWLFENSRVAKRKDGVVQSVPGFCAAYERSFWADLPVPKHKLFVEDGLATILLNIRGQVIHRIEQSLISYRLVSSSASTRNSHDSKADIINREKKIGFIGLDVLRMVDYILETVSAANEAVEPQVLATLRAHRHHGQTLADFWTTSPVSRIKRLLSARSARSFKFLLPRLLGIDVFAVAKKAFEALRTKSNAAL